MKCSSKHGQRLPVDEVETKSIYALQEVIIIVIVSVSFIFLSVPFKLFSNIIHYIYIYVYISEWYCSINVQT